MKKTKLSRISKRVVLAALTTLLVASCLVAAIITANATINFWDYSNNNHHYLYYDDSSANISDGGTRTVYFLIGHGSYSDKYTMTKVTNTRLYRLDFNVKWENATGICFGSKSSAPTTGNGTSISTARTNCTAYTSLFTTDTGFDGNTTYFFYADSSKNFQSPVKIGNTNTGDNYGSISNSITLNTKRMLVGGSSYSNYSSGNLATLKITSAWPETATAATSTTTAGSSNGTITYDSSMPAASTTFNYSSLNSAYDFVGWYNSSGTSVSTSNNYNFYQQGHKSNLTYYAYFKQKYQVTVEHGDNGNAYVGSSGTSTSAYVSQGSSQQIRAVANSGYALDYWEVTSGSITQTASNLTASTSVTPSGTTQAIKLKAHFKASNFTVSVAAGSGGSITTPSGGSYTGLEIGDEKQIVATPNNNYAFSGWTASPAANITFANAAAADTTFTASGPATITASFVQDTVHEITVTNGRPATTTQINAGTYLNPTITADDPEDDEYSFTNWTLSGNVQLVSGYSTTDPEIKIKSTGSGTTGSVTANYTHTDYIYFYGALQSNWNSDPIVTVDGAEVGVYKWLASNNTSTGTLYTLYSGSGSGTSIGGNNVYTYRVGIFRVPVAKAGKNISVFNSVQTGTNTNKGYIGTVQNEQGRCYYTYSTGTDANHSGSIAPQKVTAVTVTQSNGYDADKDMTVSKTETVYYGTKTAGQDSFTYTYQLLNASTSAVVATLDEDLPSSTSSYKFKPNAKGITTTGSYKVRIVTKDSKTGRMINSCDSSAFTINAVPTSSTVSASATNGTVSTRKYSYQNIATNTAFSNGASLRAGSTVTITMTLNNGYTQGTTTLTGISSSAVTESYNSSTRVLTFEFTVPSGGAAITVSHTASEITHTVNLVRRRYNYNGTTLIGTNTLTALTGVGIDTAVSTGKAATVSNYTFKTFVLPTGVTLASGSLTTTAAITVNATVDDATIYIDYWETVNTITVASGGNGVVKRGTTTVSGSTTDIGYITAVSLQAVPSEGYRFKEWVITKNGATSAKVGSTTYNLSTQSTYTIPASTAGATSNFRFNGTATLTANFEAVGYSIQAAFPDGNSYTLNTTTGNHVSTSIDNGHIDDTFTIDVLLADGYEVESITGTGISSTLPTPTTSGRTKSYQYTLGSSNVVATVTLKAKTPTLSNVYIKNKDNYSTFATTYASGATVNLYYKQPVMAKATTDSWATAKLNYYTYKSNGTTINAQALNQTSGTAVSVAADTTIIPTTADGYVTYTFKVIAKNSPAGVAEATKTNTYTINVTFNDAQKAYFNLNKLFSKCVRESTSNNPYYKTGAPLGTYNDAYDAAEDYIDLGYPDYNADVEATSTAQSNYNTFKGAYDSLKLFAKTTTVYVLTNYANNASYPMRISAIYENSDDWKHFYMLTSENDSYKSGTSDTDGVYAMTFGGTVYKSGNRYYYTFTYYGHVGFKVWRGSSSDDVEMASSEQITGAVTKPTDFKDYYVNRYATSVGTTTAATASEYTDFGHTWDTSTKKLIDLNQTRTLAQLKTLFSVAPSGSMVTGSNPGITTYETAATVVGPIGKSTSRTYDLTNTSSPNYVASFPAKYSGKYKVYYTTRFGYDANGDPILRTAEMTLYVATDEVDIYVDMNDNVGNPILKLKYWVNSSGDPVAAGTSGATAAYLPYEMDLVTGSESVYKYTIKISKLETDYKMTFSASSPIYISYINVEGVDINGGNANGFAISTEARVTGEVWFKADKTNLTTFNNISYGSVTKSFMAVDASNNYLTGGIDSVHGTGIVVDHEVKDANDNDGDLYNAKYAAIYTLDGASAPINVFSYNVKAKAKEEFTVGNNTYYFDKWVSVKTPAEGNPDLSTAEDYSTNPELNFNKGVEYGDGSPDVTYVAKYKLVSSGDSTVRVVVTYNFKDYDTSDGNYVYDANKDTVDASYTKTIKVTVGSGQTYANFAAVNKVAAINAIVGSPTNRPYIKSRYFDYDYTAGSAEIDSAVSAESKIVVHASFTETAHPYKIVVKNGSTITQTLTGYYQQSATINNPLSNPVFKDSANNVIATGSIYKAVFISSGYETDSNQDCQIIKIASQQDATVTHKSVITNSFTEQYVDGTTPKLKHNFYIVDYCTEGELVGGGVLYATTDGTNYRQANAATQLASVSSRRTFITTVLGGDYDTEYKAQTINNVGFRYKPYNDKEDVYRYSDDLHAYKTIFEASNNNSSSYENQKLRVFSFMVYNNGGSKVIVPSEGYAEVERYIIPEA